MMDPNKLAAGASVWVYLGKSDLPPWNQQLSTVLEKNELLHPPNFETATVIAITPPKGRERLDTQVRVRLERTGASITIAARRVYPR